MPNRNSKAGTAADGSTLDEVPTSSQTIAKPHVSGGVIKDRKYYVDNCIWYIQQYFDDNGHVSRKEAEDAAHNLLLHIAAHRR
jgi:hypothetical protein